MRRVGLVIPNFSLGGTERQAVQLARHLPEFGWQPWLLAAECDGPQLAGGRDMRIVDLDSKLGRGMKSPRFWTSLIGTTLRLRSAAQQHRLEVLESFLFWQNQLAIPAGLLSSQVRAVVTGRRNTGAFKDRRPIYQRIENLTNPWCDAIVCNSEAVRRDVLRRERVETTRVHVIPNGVDADHFAKANSESPLRDISTLRDASIIIGTVGNMKRQKRHDIFLRALAEIRRSLPGACGVIVGRDLGEEHGLRELASQLGIAEAVHFAGGVDDPAPWYRAMTLFLLTSDHEGMPNVLMEAAASRTPILTREVEGVAELFPRPGLVAVEKSADPSILAGRAVALLADRGPLDQQARAAQSHIAREFSLRALAQRHAALYEQLAPGVRR